MPTPSAPGRGEQPLHTRHDHLGQPFAGFEHDIADKAVTDRHIRLATIKPITFDEPSVVKTFPSLLKQLSSGLDLLIAFDVFDPDVQQGDTWIIDTQRLCRGCSHDCELVKLLGLAVHVRPKVKKQAGAS